MSEVAVNGVVAAEKPKAKRSVTAKTSGKRRGSAKKRSAKSAKRPNAKMLTKRGKPSAKHGAGRREGEWIMSVHIPIPLMKKLDAKIKALAKAGKEGASRSAFCVLALKSKL